MNIARGSLGLFLCAICSSLAAVPVHAQPPAPAQAPPAAAAPPPAPTPIPFDAALLKAANDLLSKANLNGAPDKVTLVIDPLFDGVTGARSEVEQLGRAALDGDVVAG